MKLSEKIILRRLAKNDINISLQELYETIDIYKKVIDYYLEDFKYERSSPLSFLHTPIRVYSETDKTFLLIFRRILDIKRKGLLKYLDFALLKGCNDSFFETELSQLNDLSSYLGRMCRSDNFLIKIIKHDNYFIQNVIDSNLSSFMNSKIIPDDYKQMVKLYSEIFDKFYNEGFYELNFEKYDYKIGLDYIVSFSYFYFLNKDFISNNIEEIISFLNNINNNMELYIEKINMFGLNSNEYLECFTLIDYLLKNINKVIVKK